MTGLIVVAVVLAAATAVGLVRRRRDGRFRAVGEASAARPGVRIESAAGAATPFVAVAGDQAAGRAACDGPLIPGAPTARVSAGDVGAALGERATLVQFSTAFCQPCRVARRVLGEVAAAVPGVVHVEVDAESHLDLVRRFDIVRTPTVLVIDGDGLVVRRASGAPRKEQVLSALADLESVTGTVTAS